MEIRMNAQIIKKLREDRAWSQEHLAAVAGVSLRTIQRVESESKASPETRLALASAFGVDVAQLAEDSALAVPQAEGRMSWRQYRALRLVLLLGFLIGLNVYQSGGLTWVRWVLVIGGLLMGLRWLRSRFVVPRSC